MTPLCGKNSIRLRQEILLLGDHTLDVLHNTINCPNNIMTFGEHSQAPNKVKMKPLNKDIFKSSLFYFEDTLYINDYEPNALDYSQVILQWAQKTNCDFKNLKTDSMEHKRFKDLKLKMGYPYLYQHQGQCEHLVVFLNARFVDRCDELAVDQYPMTKNIPNQRLQRCTMCIRMHASWLVMRHADLPHEPTFYCEECFCVFHYGSGGKKVGEFDAYYFQNHFAFKINEWISKGNSKKSDNTNVPSADRTHDMKIKQQPLS